MADILNRLLLDTKNFDANLSSSKRSVNDYSGSVSDMARTAGNGIMKFAGYIGIAVGASEAFVKTVNSSQTTGDAWAKMQDQMKASVDSFFASIAMGNFDGFLSNLQNVIDKAGDLSVALDNLGTKTLFNNGEVNDLNTSYQIEMNKAKARNISDEERNKHLENAKLILYDIVKLQGSLAKANKDTSYTELQAEIAKQGFNRNISKDTWEYLLKDSNRPDVEKWASNYDKTVSSYNGRIQRSKEYDPATEQSLDTAETRKIKAEFDKFKKSTGGKFGEMAKMFLEANDAPDSAIKKALDKRAVANNLMVSISQKELEISNVGAKINGSYNSQNSNGGNAGSHTIPPPPPVGSIAAIDAELSKLNKELITATTTQARIAAQTTIEELEARKIKLKFEAQYGESKLPNASNDKMAGVLNGGTEKTKGSLGTDLKKFNKIKSPVNKKDVDMLDKYQEGLYGIGDIMRSMSGIMGEGAASWLNWGASLLSSVAQAIPAIRALIPALQAKAAGEAVAAGPLGWISAGAAVLSVIAAFASIPSFSTGGVYTGGSTFGDMNLARVNAGEMILNGGQQSNLFRLLNDGNAGGQPSGGAVTFTINGRDLKGVLENYNTQKRKVI